jgi:UDP-2,3-diacylglucosamine hydrolase
MVYFFSDVHLGIFHRSEDITRENILLEFLDKISLDAELIVIAGDLFDYWFEYKTVIPKYFYRTLSSLWKLRQKGISIEYLMGNHDFGHFDFFQNEFGIEIRKADINLEIEGKKFYISHGDGKALNDRGYLILKSIIRSRLSNFIYRKIHPDCGIRLASTSSKKSRKYTDNKNYGTADGLETFAQKKIDEGFDYVVMGHRHRAAKKKMGKGFYINLGDWLHNPTFGRFDGKEFHLEYVDEFLKN